VRGQTGGRVENLAGAGETQTAPAGLRLPGGDRGERKTGVWRGLAVSKAGGSKLVEGKKSGELRWGKVTKMKEKTIKSRL